jgi:hypothetical protein
LHFTLADLVSDIAQNGAESGAEVVELEVKETGGGGKSEQNSGEFRFTVRDNGKGMSQEELKRAQDPFFTDGIKHPHRKVGLGLPFLMQTAEQSGGGWEMKSEKGKGTEICAWFDTANVDMPPIGDISGMFRTILLFPGPKEIVIRRSSENKGIDYELRKTELVEALGGLEDTESLLLLNRYLHSEEETEEEDE